MDSFEGLDLGAKALHLAIGMFDGVHLGHQAVIEAAVRSARSGGISGVLTFWPHPSRLLNPDNPTPQIMMPKIKNRVLRDLGVQIVIQECFTRNLAETEAEDFLPRLKKALPTLESIYIGENYRFGKGRRGDVSLLVSQAKELAVGVYSAQRIKRNGRDISSTRIRKKLQEGRIKQVNALLGYTYFSQGLVESGMGRGSKLGFPTLNLAWNPELRPAYGVYAVEVISENTAQVCPGVANYGVRPTFSDQKIPILEIHLFNETDLSVGKVIEVHWKSFLRAEKRFSDSEALKSQVSRDKVQAMKFFSDKINVR